MSSAMEVILLERIESLGHMGETVKVKPGYARNYLLPQKKALRATKDNVAYFESQRAALEKVNDEKKSDATKQTKKLEKLKVALIRHAAESGHLYGSVSSRDIAEVVSAASGVNIHRNMVSISHPLKTIGLFPVTIALHPEVKIDVTINIARSEDEAKVQAKIGKALIAETDQQIAAAAAANDDAKAALLEEGALKAEQEGEVEAAEKAAADAEKSAKKAKARKPKKEAKADEAEAAEGEAAESVESDAAKEGAE